MINRRSAHFCCLIILALLFLSCHGDTRLSIKNESIKPIYYIAGFTYPDTSIPSNSPDKCEVKEQRLVFFSLNKWEKQFKMMPAETLMVFIFDADTVENNPWERVRSEYKILKRYDFSLQDLKDKNWKVAYP